LNTIVDASVLNFLLFATSRQELVFYSLFKGVSFSVAVIFSFFMNRFFVFKKQGNFKIFIAISIIGAFLNIGVATLANKVCIANLGQHLFILCANIGFLAGATTTIIWNYLGYKFFAFKDKEPVS